MSKKQQIMTGSNNFKKVISESDVFVDKSLFIKEIIDSGDEAILITRPRRWGKSLNLDMLKTFFAVESVNNEAVDNMSLFQGGIININGKEKTLKKLEIAKKCPDCLDKQGKYPVIFMDFKDMIYENPKLVAQAIRTALIENYRQNNLDFLDANFDKFTIDKRIVDGLFVSVFVFTFIFWSFFKIFYGVIDVSNGLFINLFFVLFFF